MRILAWPDGLNFNLKGFPASDYRCVERPTGTKPCQGCSVSGDFLGEGSWMVEGS